MSQAAPSSQLTRAAQLLDKGEPAQARVLIQQTLRTQPTNLIANQLMRHAMTRLGELDTALYYAKRAHATNPADPDLSNILAVSLGNLGRLDEAEGALRATLKDHPEHAMNQAALAGILAKAGKFPAAIEFSQQAIDRGLPAAAIVGPASTSMLMLGQADQAAMLLRAAHQSEPGNALLLSTLCAVLLLAPSAPATDLVGAHYALGRLLARHSPKHNQPEADTADPSRPLRMGVVVGALDSSFLECVLAPVLESLAAAGSPLRVYLMGPVDPAFAKRLRDRGDMHVVDAVALAPAVTARRMIDDRLDVVIDAAGHTSPPALMTLHLRGAPLQVSALAYPFTTGVLSIDARLSDESADPARADIPGGERILRLARPAFAFRPPADLPAPGPAPARSHPDGAITFGCITHAQRLCDQLVRMYASLVRQLPGATLLIHNSTLAEKSCKAQLARRFELAGLSPSRLILDSTARSLADKAALLSRVDIALDTAPMPGPLEACLAVHMGVPVVTLSGQTPARRQSAGILSSVGLGDLIADDEDAFANIAQSLARDTQRRESLRDSLRATLAASPLGDPAGLAADIIQALRHARAG